MQASGLLTLHPLYPLGENPTTDWVGGWVGPRLFWTFWCHSIAHMATIQASQAVWLKVKWCSSGWSSVMLGWLHCLYKDEWKYVSLLQTNTHSCKASFTIWLLFFWRVYIIPYFLSSKRTKRKSLRVQVVLDMWCSVKGLVVPDI